MLDLHKLYPQYGLDQHKGYPTPAHKEAVRVHGPSPIHRRTFAPLKHWFPLPEKEEAEGQGAEDEPKKSGKGGKKRKRTKA